MTEPFVARRGRTCRRCGRFGVGIIRCETGGLCVGYAGRGAGRRRKPKWGVKPRPRGRGVRSAR